MALCDILNDECASDKLSMLPSSLRYSTFAQGALLFHSGPLLPNFDPANTLTITVATGHALLLSLPSSTELYAILLVIYLLGSKNLQGTIYTDFQEAVTVSLSPSILRSMSHTANLPLYFLLLAYLGTFPSICLSHVKAHGPTKKMPNWTRQQWGNYSADKIAKNDTVGFSDNHLY